MSSLSDGIIALKAKNFLANLTFELVKLVEEITPTGKWEERIEALIQNSLTTTFKLNPNQDAAQQSKSFLQGLGFTPSEVLWKEDMRQGKIHLGTSRLWEVNMNDVTSHLIVNSIIKTICTLILKGDANLQMLTDQELPPRYKIGFQFSDVEGAMRITKDSNWYVELGHRIRDQRNWYAGFCLYFEVPQ